MWSELLVLFSSITAAFILFFFSGREHIHTKLHLSLALLFLAAGFSSLPIVDFAMNLINEWSSIFSVTFLLIMYATIIREFKPVYSRYPIGFTYTPFAIPLVYPFISDTEILKILLNQILQGGALVIALLLYLPVIRKLRDHYFYILAVGLMGVTYVIYWFDPVGISQWVWHLTMVVGIITGTYSINKLLTNIHTRVSG